MTSRLTVLISCTATKRDEPSTASDLYVSPLFNKSRSFASALGGPWFILSARYGLVEPEAFLDPYEVSLKQASKAARLKWAQDVAEAVSASVRPDSEIVVLAGKHYAHPLRGLLERRGYEVLEPLANGSIGQRLRWLTKAAGQERRALDLERLYAELRRMAATSGGPELNSMASTREVPLQGVYFFFDDTERRWNGLHRVVRVGTHGVVRSSGASLRSRLRAHVGPASGVGSHRSSVFRRHVGAAMMQREGAGPVTWGIGTTAPREVRLDEASLEATVSSYIRTLRYICVAVPGEAGPRNDRAYLERNSIALLSTVGHHFDPPSPEWLGCMSDRASIRAGGLWNVNHVGIEYDPAFIPLLRTYVDHTLDPAFTTLTPTPTPKALPRQEEIF
jgi:hypothetical protein